MDIRTGRLNRLERTLEGWPFWKRFLLVLFGYGVLGFVLGGAEFAVWLVEKFTVN